MHVVNSSRYTRVIGLESMKLWKISMFLNALSKLSQHIFGVKTWLIFILNLDLLWVKIVWHARNCTILHKISRIMAFLWLPYVFHQIMWCSIAFLSWPGKASTTTTASGNQKKCRIKYCNAWSLPSLTSGRPSMLMKTIVLRICTIGGISIVNTEIRLVISLVFWKLRNSSREVVTGRQKQASKNSKIRRQISIWYILSITQHCQCNSPFDLASWLWHLYYLCNSSPKLNN